MTQAIGQNGFLSSDFLIEVAKGNVTGHSIVNKFGANDATTSGDDVWQHGGPYVFPTAATAMEIASNSAGDTFPAGAGARTIAVYGLDENWEEKTQTVNLAGISAVPLDGTWWRVFRVVILSAGSIETNDGEVHVQDQATSLVFYAGIKPGEGQTQMAIYTVPSGKTAYFLKGYVGISDDDKNGEVVVFRWKARANPDANGAWATKGQISVNNIGSGTWQYEYGAPAGPLPEKTDIRIEAAETTATVGTVGDFDLLLVDN